MTKRVAALLVAALPLAACIVAETRHTLYLEPDGAVTWVVMEEAIHSDAADPAEREAEERQFLERFLAGEHGVAVALDALHPRRLDCRMLRHRAPFAVRTEAEFGNVEWLLEDLFEAASVPARVDLVHEGGINRLTVAVRTEVDGSGADEGDEGAPVLALVADEDDYRIVLTRGRFVEAVGFDLSAGDTVAALDEDTLEQQALEPEDGEVVLTLAWEVPSP